MLRSLQNPDEPDVLEKIIGKYLQQSPTLLRDICNAVNSGDNFNLSESAHSLKSASANLGALELAQICEELENMGRHARAEAAKELIGKLEDSFEAALNALKIEIEKPADTK